MEVITKYVALDGREFTDKEECVNYELLIEKVTHIMKPLTTKPDNIDFSNGEGFIQHDKSELRNIQIQILELCKKYIDHKWIQKTIDDENVDLSYVARLLDDSNIRPLYNAWNRFMCVDSQGREWGQPYFANNPEEGIQKCLE